MEFIMNLRLPLGKGQPLSKSTVVFFSVTSTLEGDLDGESLQ